jgi:FkbM family methyltransferase
LGKLGKGMKKSYSQAGQDLWVLEILKGKKNGFFLDVGAYDGIKYSNSFLLEKEFGWSGLLIEAHPGNFGSIKKIRTSTLVTYAISDSNGNISFEKDCNTGSKISEKGELITVPSITFEDLFLIYDIPSTIDYMSLDIEGYEYKSLLRFPFDEYKCKLITVEHNLYMGDSSNKEGIKHLLTNNGYTLEIENVSHQGLPFEDWYINKSIM